MPTANSQQNLADLGFSADALAQRKAELLKALGQVAPELIADNQFNLEALKDLLGEETLAKPEHYELNWAGKSAARREIQKTTSHTLKPAANNPEHAQHMLIEGENLEVLRVLQKSYYGKIKMIYIDPPYNTGNDSFVYPDDYSETLDEYLKRTGEKNEDGYLNKQSLWKKNSKESGQYHSAWLSMMYPRLYLARNLLRDDGVIFISIDDNEQANLKLLCDEVFGAENFAGVIKRRAARKTAFLSNFMTDMCDYIMIYVKSDFADPLSDGQVSDPTRPVLNNGNAISVRTLKTGSEARCHDGEYKAGIYTVRSMSFNLLDDLKILNGKVVNDVEIKAPWRINQEILDTTLYITKNFGLRRYVLPEELNKSKLLNDLHDNKDFYNEIGTEQLLELLGGEYFDNPKPSRLIGFLINSANIGNNDIILDFFAGSGTTAHAVMELNAEDGGNRQSISVQMPELLEEKSEAYKAGYRTIADITRARINKVIEKLKAEQPDKTQELACANFTLAPSNFKVWQTDLTDIEAVRKQLEIFQQAEKELEEMQLAPKDQQTAMLTELLLKNGLGILGVHAISRPKKLACGISLHRVLMPDDNQLWLCFEPYQEALKEEIIKAKPAQVILLNSCFAGTAADEQLSNLQLELAHHEIKLLVI